MEWDEAQNFPRPCGRAGGAGPHGHPVPEDRRGGHVGGRLLHLHRGARAGRPVGRAVGGRPQRPGGRRTSPCSAPRHKRRWVRPLAQGDMLGAWGLTEAGAGSDAAAMRTTATRTAGWAVGPKQFITNGHRRRRGRHGRHRSRGATAASRHSSSSGARQGWRPARRSTSSACGRATRARWSSRTAASRPTRGSARKARGSSTRCRCSTPAGSGLPRWRSASRRAPSRRRGYARERRQFGRAIGGFQAIQWKLADMATRIEAARLLVYRAAWLRDARADVARIVDGQAVRERDGRARGRRGRADSRRLRFREGLPGREVLRDVKLCTIGEGTSEIQRLVIARQLLGR